MLRTARPEDAADYTAWLGAASDINLVGDYRVYSYPACATLIVEDRQGQRALINSFHPVLMLEALAPRPGLTPLQEARALKELFDGIKKIAEAAGIKEIYFGCKDERLTNFIEGRGFERVSFPMFRFRIS